MIFLNLFYIIIPFSIILTFLWAPPAEILGEASRILYFHVPVAWISTLAFFISGILSIVYLYDKNKKYKLLLIEEKAFNSAVLGMIFIILATISGAIWSKISWGAYWNWDPRQISIIALLLVYLAYFSLRSVLAENPNRGKLSSAYLIIAMATVPFLIFVIPRMYASLHPDPIINPEVKVHLDNAMKITLLLSIAGFTFLFLYLLSLANKISKINNLIEEKFNE
jgi:heme exporter protein C